MRFLHLSDTHLGYRQYGLIEREKDLYEAFNEAVNIAIGERVDVVLHGGDLFEHAVPTPVAYREAIIALKKLKEEGIPFYVAPGNHELPKAKSRGSPVRVLEELGLLHSPSAYEEPSEFRLGDVSLLVFSGWASGKLKERVHALKASGRVKVALAHLLLCDVTPLSHGNKKCEMEAREIPPEYSYVALGHLHVPWEQRIEERIIAYSGSTDFLSLQEYRRERNRYVLLVDVEGREVRVQKVKLEKTRPWVYVEGSELDARKALEKLPEHEKSPLLFLYLSGSSHRLSELLKRLEELVKSGKILTYRHEFQEQKPRVEDRAQGREERVSLDSIVRRLFKDEELSAALLELLAEPEEEAERFLRRLEESRDLRLKLRKALGVI
ncbi:MAG: exonuclease SbcCD subunit D [Acidilobaceae archaeon]|nr:exonuclease SbcCD subunit D [Acidilobaceae archaeon]